MSGFYLLLLIAQSLNDNNRLRCSNVKFLTLPNEFHLQHLVLQHLEHWSVVAEL